MKNFPPPTPIERFLLWYGEAQGGTGGLKTEKGIMFRGAQKLRRLAATFLPWSNLLRPDIATLATVSTENRPSARSILFKGIVRGGFSFFTDVESSKGKELAANPSAVMVFYWHLPPRQVRIDGQVERLSRKEAEDDWNGRRRENQAASAAATQSSVIGGREELLDKVNRIKRRYAGRPIPCPDSWGGYRLIPDTIEFWEGRFDWLHQRERYVRNEDGWEKAILAP